MTQRTLHGTILIKVRVSGFLTRMRTKSAESNQWAAKKGSLEINSVKIQFFIKI